MALAGLCARGVPGEWRLASSVRAQLAPSQTHRGWVLAGEDV